MELEEDCKQNWQRTVNKIGRELQTGFAGIMCRIHKGLPVELCEK